MKKKLLIIIALFVFNSTLAQFKTTFDINGDPLSEIIDPLNMKQGEWNYYDINNTLFKQEVYKDNELILRKYFVQDSNINTLKINNEIFLNLENKNFKIHGEAIVDDKGKILKLFYYLNDNYISKKSIKENEKELKRILKKNNINKLHIIYF